MQQIISRFFFCQIQEQQNFNAFTMRGLSRTTQLLIAVVVACAVLILINMLELQSIKEQRLSPQRSKSKENSQPKYVIYTKDVSTRPYFYLVVLLQYILMNNIESLGFSLYQRNGEGRASLIIIILFCLRVKLDI